MPERLSLAERIAAAIRGQPGTAWLTAFGEPDTRHSVRLVELNGAVLEVLAPEVLEPGAAVRLEFAGLMLLGEVESCLATRGGAALRIRIRHALALGSARGAGSQGTRFDE